MSNIYKVGNVVQVGALGEREKIIEVFKPLGTYTMYKVHLYHSGKIATAAKHELIKGMPDSDFQDLFDCFANKRKPNAPSSTNSSKSCLDEISVPEQSDIEPKSKYTKRPASVVQPPAPTKFVVRQPKVSTQCVVPPPVTSKSIVPEPTTFVLPRPETPKSAAPQLSSTKSSSFEKRFAPLSVTPAQYREGNENKNTKSKTNSHMKVLNQYLNHKGENRTIDQIPPRELDNHLQHFLLSIRTTEGKEYEPSTLRGMLCSFDRYLRENEYETSIAKGKEFTRTMATYASKGKELKGQGKGNRDNAADVLTNQEVDALYATGQLGQSSPNSIINSLWLNNTVHFGIRAGGTEHRQLMWGDIRLGFDFEENAEYLEYNERQTKTRTGIDINNIRLQKPRMYATSNKEKCPVALYKTYSDKRPDGFSGENDPFYLATATIDVSEKEGCQWFVRGPIGKNKLNNIMRTMATKANLPSLKGGKRLTNTSARKRLCQALIQAIVPDTQAVHITGHKNPCSLNNYRVLSNNQQRNISNILTGESSHVPVPQQPINSIMPPMQSSQSIQSQASIVQQSNKMPSFFGNATITGGTFNITIQGMKRAHDEE